MIVHIMLLAALGLCVSIYTYLTEQRLKKDPTYKPVCDLSDRISCSKPMLSPYANLFFASNAVMGILFYTAMMILALIGSTKLVLLGALLSCCASAGLAYLLYVKIQAFCILCTSLYIINILMFIHCIKLMIF